MPNVVTLHPECPNKPKMTDDPSAALANLAEKVAQMAQLPMHTKEHIQQTIFLIGLFNARVRQFIQRIEDCEARTRLFAHSEAIEKLVEIARLKAAKL